MRLDPRQLSSLHEMGIPVWELRSEQTQKTVAENESVRVPTQIIAQQQLLDSRCFVMIDPKTHHEQKQKLLEAMLFSIGLSLEQLIIIQIEQLMQLETLRDPKKLLIIMGDELRLASSLPLLNNGNAHQIIESNISTITTLSLTSLLSDPDNKAIVWQDLKLIKKFFSSC